MEVPSFEVIGGPKALEEFEVVSTLLARGVTATVGQPYGCAVTMNCPARQRGYRLALGSRFSVQGPGFKVQGSGLASERRGQLEGISGLLSARQGQNLALTAAHVPVSCYALQVRVWGFVVGEWGLGCVR